jgi:hypothetical protein
MHYHSIIKNMKKRLACLPSLSERRKVYCCLATFQNTRYSVHARRIVIFIFLIPSSVNINTLLRGKFSETTTQTPLKLALHFEKECRLWIDRYKSAFILIESEWTLIDCWVARTENEAPLIEWTCENPFWIRE